MAHIQLLAVVAICRKNSLLHKVLLLVLFLERTKFIVLGTKDPEGYEQKAEIRIMCYYFKASRVTSRPSTFSQFPTELLTADVYG